MLKISTQNFSGEYCFVKKSTLLLFIAISFIYFYIVKKTGSLVDYICIEDFLEVIQPFIRFSLSIYAYILPFLFLSIYLLLHTNLFSKTMNDN